MRNLLILLIFSFLFTSCQESENVKIIRLGHGLSTTHSVHQAMVYMDSVLRVKSNGKMKIQIYPSEQLGTERQCLELLQIGSLDMTKVSTGSLENFSPNIKVFGLPFLFRDRQHSYSVLDGPIGRDLLSGTEKYWLKGLAYYDAGARSFYTKEKKINSPEDLDGLKIRVMESKTAFDMVKALGGSPTPISFGELYTSLQQGVVDGAENNPPSFYLSRHYEVCKYYTLDEHTILPDVLLMSTHIWDSFSDKERGWLSQAVKESITEQRKLWAKSEKQSLDAVKEAGVEIIIPDKTLFSKKSKIILESYKEDEVLYDFINRIKNTK
ncbi:MAG: TRAP transporter substrate-binding protein [Pelagibacterales bacterium]|nr:TRAP transporter substrate-binding protein [Pelagibacterales bacterium]MDG2173141.1 TRAP transporter substrate-binding protein [Flavobacteriaceae bacterium]